jgi:6-phosphogluconolactonase
VTAPYPSVLLAHARRDDCVRQLARDLAVQLAAILSLQARASLLLPGGSSPQPLLPLLAAEPLEWARVDVSPTDERWVAADAEQSNWRLLQQGLPAASCLDPRQADSAQASATLWADQLQARQPFAAVLLGMGEDGHIASLFPGMPGLAEALDLQVAPGALCAQAPSEPRQRLSLNLPMLLQTQWLGLLAFGQSKKQLIDAVLADTPQSRALPLHALLTAGRLPLRIYWAP